MTTRVRAPMPGDEEPPPRPHGWRLPVYGLVAIAVAMIAMMAIDAMTPNGYAYRHGIANGPPWHYPVDEVVFCTVVVAVEALVLVLVLRARGEASIAGRAIVLGVGTFVVMFMFGLLAMHADRTMGDLFLWHLAASAWLVVFGLGRIMYRMIR
jgi:hypothetical protein